MNRNDSVQDDEELYQSVRGKLEYDEYSYNDARELTIQPAAFRDRNREPSVDRAKLREFDPSLSKLSDTDGIVSLMTSDVRAIPVEDRTIEDHTIDVIYNPISENPAHSQITMTPKKFISNISNSRQSKAFKSLQKALALLATENGWTLEPKAN